VSILKWLGLSVGPAPDPHATQVVQRITQALETLEPERARYLAAFAYLLGRVAHADHAVTEPEIAEMERIVQMEGDLPSEQAQLVVQIARHESFLSRGTEDFPVTQEFRAISTPEQRRALLRCLFAVSASDDSVVLAEDNEIRKISIELKVPHEDFVKARAEWRAHLAVLRPGGRAPSRR
jgi:uncharacterized tellurite resistance protein B-like protein